MSRGLRTPPLLIPSLPCTERTLAFSTSLSMSQRPFTARFMDSLGDRLSDSVDTFTKQTLLQDERMVTESRRKLERFQSAPETLAERVAAQRSIRRFLIPSDIKIDKSKMYMEFTWPEEAIAAAALLEKAEQAFQARRHTTDAAGNTLEPEVQHAQAPDVILSPPPLTEAELRKEIETARTKGMSGDTNGIAEASETRDPDGDGGNAPKPWMRTRALAEYLRAYTTSTDGQYSSPRFPIYGRRGLTITDVYPIGNYALRIVFSDGHTGGIYSYEYLYFLTSPGNKYSMMRAYLANLRQHRKSRDPPKRAASRRRRILQEHEKAPAEPDLGVGRKLEDAEGGEGGHLAPAFSKP